MTTPNLQITAYLSETLDFYIDAPNQPFWIKQKPETGVGEADPIWANVMENNGAEAGRLRVRFNQPGDYYYVSEVDPRLSGKIVILPSARRFADTPNQTFVVKTGLPIAKASDAMVLIPGDNGLTDIAGGTNWIFNRPNDTPGYEDIFPLLGYAQQVDKKMGAGSLFFDTPGHPDVFVRNDWYGRDTEIIPDLPSSIRDDIGVLRAWGGAGSTNSTATAELFPFSDSWTLEFWIKFKTFNEDDPTFNADHPANSRVTDLGAPISSYYRRPPFIRLVETQEDYYVDTFEEGEYGPVYKGSHYPTNLQINFHPNPEPETDLAYFDVQIWTNDRARNTPPQFQYDFELPRITLGNDRTDIITKDVWSHVAFTKDVERGAFSVYVDGSRYGQVFDSVLSQPMDALGDDYLVALGGWARASATQFEFDDDQVSVLAQGPVGEEDHASLNGYMDDIRITRGISYRESSYDVPAAPHPLTP